MGDTHDGNEPSLELPGLFGRKRKQPKPAPAPEQAEPTAAIPQVAATPAPSPAPETAPEATQVLTPPVPVAPTAPAPTPVAPGVAAEPKRSRFSRRGGLDKLDQPTSAEPKEPREPREFSLPALPSRVAAAVTGLVVGLAGSLLTFGALQGCQQLRGTDSCGGPGFFILLLILVVMIVLGSALLLAWEVSDAKSTSALAIGIVCVVVLMLLMEQLLEPWMFVVVPVLCALSYLGAHLLTTTLADEDVVS